MHDTLVRVGGWAGRVKLTIMGVEVHCASVIRDEHLLLTHAVAVCVCLIDYGFLVDDLNHNLVAMCLGGHLVELKVCAREQE